MNDQAHDAKYTYWTYSAGSRLYGVRRVGNHRLTTQVLHSIHGWTQVTHADYIAARRELAARRKRERREKVRV